jgi:LacI family transcriptional regulator, galactose operon repressor
MTKKRPSGKPAHESKSPARSLTKTVSLRTLADFLKLSPATVSVVMNDSPAANAIPAHTKERIKKAARQLHYRPNFFARSLSLKRGFMIGVLTPELSDGYHTMVMSGIGDYLMREGYFYLSAHHRHKADLIEEYPRLLLSRGAEGIIAIDTVLTHRLSVPVVAIAGHEKIPGVTNVVLDHRRAAELILRHLFDLGHRRIAFMHGQPFSSDSDDRFSNLMAMAPQLGVEVSPELIVQLERDLTSPELGYPVVRQLLNRGQNFTALVAFNDMSAIGAIRALRDAGLRVPEDVSVIGFDDIQASAYMMPRLTTIRQPLRQMGELAAKHLLQRISKGNGRAPQTISIAPELLVRESTGPVPPEVISNLAIRSRKSAPVDADG